MVFKRRADLYDGTLEQRRSSDDVGLDRLSRRFMNCPRALSLTRAEVFSVTAEGDFSTSTVLITVENCQ